MIFSRVGKRFLPLTRNVFFITKNSARLYSLPRLKDTDEDTHEMMDILGRQFERDSMTNIPTSILPKLSEKLLTQPHSPLSLLWSRIQSHFDSTFPHTQVSSFDYLRHDDPVVTVKQNFDEVLIPPSHPSRSPHDSYFFNRHWMLRTHMTAHEREIMATGRKRFLLVGDVYRRDEIDTSHMPVFHQLEGVRIFSPDELLSKNKIVTLPEDIERALEGQEFQSEYDPNLVRLAIGDLHYTLNSLLRNLFGEQVQIRWQATYFPFTLPSLEAEVFYGGKWLEVFGSGILQRQFLHPSVLEKDPNAIAWAFGMGLERVAMVLHDIPDIRLFWSKDPRFHSQFISNDLVKPTKFTPFSKYPPIHRDISFWINDLSFQPNEFFEIIRNIAGDLVESVTLLDEYVDNSSNRSSRCYRCTYRAMDRTLTDEVVNDLQSLIRNQCQESFQITLR